MRRFDAKKFLNLGFYPRDIETELPLQLGKRPKTRSQWLKVRWQIAAWLLVAIGIFVRQGLQFPPITWDVTQLNVGTFLGSLIIALAVFPWFMRWINRKRPEPSLEHAAAPFAFGFFLDLSALAIVSAIKLVPFGG